jgi:hypothetical protein
MRPLLLIAIFTASLLLPTPAPAFLTNGGFWNAASAPSCGGTSYGGYCWYPSTSGGDCDTACASHSGCNATAITQYGSSGSMASCQALLRAMGFPSPDGAYDNDFWLGWGCGQYYYAPYGRFDYHDTYPSSCAASQPPVTRACACNS